MKIGDYCYVTYKNNTYVIGKINYIDNNGLFKVNVYSDSAYSYAQYNAWINSSGANYVIAESIDDLKLNKRILNKLNKVLKMIVFQ